ncbi:hypothetical protein FLAV_02337 [Flavobacteriales bacterium]|nr:hypothetical protein [Flavobacteriales bacterium]MCL4816767.1 hypothetical protein [Flavobacteriales bacterium]WKZ74094.1 MAG: hypothetical protein QY303_08035 [Vicingaceae bacterium]CAG0991612.1 hypothetical protein FLAV_02337 [Flavobacteriales bacterium]
MKKIIFSFIIAIMVGITSTSAQSKSNNASHQTTTQNRLKQKPAKRTISANTVSMEPSAAKQSKPTNTPPQNGGSLGRKEIKAQPAPENALPKK